MNDPKYDMRTCSIDDVRGLCEKFHGYGSAGSVSVYAFGVWEAERLIAAYAWQPPPPGAAKAICPEAPYAVLALSRMVAVDKKDRRLNHISKPLRRQMKVLIDRGRWPVLITYSDESMGHTGHVYLCSGWQHIGSNVRTVFVTNEGHRASAYADGGYGCRRLIPQGTAIIHRWEHWACERGDAAKWLAFHGWQRVPIPGKVWRSGNPAYKLVRS